MKLILLPIFLSILASCGQNIDVPKNDPEFDSVREMFILEAQKRGVKLKNTDISISFSDVPQKQYKGGICVTRITSPGLFSNVKKISYILISPDMKYKPAHEIERVLFHEFGHCLLYLEHNQKRSIMNNTREQINSLSNDYSLNRKYYLDQLFLGKDTFPKATKICTQVELAQESVENVEYQILGQTMRYKMFKTKDSVCVEKDA